MCIRDRLSAAGVLAWFVNKRATEQDDPWARPLADPYVPPTAGRDTTVEGPASGLGDDVAATFAPSAGQISDVPPHDNDLIPPSDAQLTGADPAEGEADGQGDQRPL